MAAELAIIAKLDDQASRGLNQIESEMTQLDKAGATVGKGFSAAGAAVAAIGVATAAATAAVGAFAVSSTKEFIGFQDSMNEVFTLLPGITQDAMSQMSDQVLQFGADVGRTSEEIIPALYQSLSAGVPADNVFSFLETAHMAALGGVADLEVAVDGISSVVNAYGAEVIDATQASDLMFTAVRLGKTTFGELSANLSNVTPLASAMGVSFGDVTAALAAMTAQGTPTAQATTQMRALLQELGTEGTVVNKVFQDVAGEGFLDFIAGGGNVAEALQLVQEHADATGTPIQDLFGNVRAGLGALQLTGAGMETFVANLEEMENSAGATQAAYETMNSGMARIFEQLGAIWEGFKIQVGAALAPVVETAAEGLRDFAQNTLPLIQEKVQLVMDAFGKFFGYLSEGSSFLGALQMSLSELLRNLGLTGDEISGIMGPLTNFIIGIQDFIARAKEVAAPIMQWIASFVSLKDVLIAAGLVIGGVIVAAIASLIASMLPIIAVVGAVIGVIALLRNAWESDFAGIRTAVEGLIAKVQEMGGIGAVFEEIKNKVMTAIQPIADFLAPTFERIKEAFMSVGDSAGPLQGKLEVLKNAFSGLMTALQPVAAFVGAVLVVAFKLFGEIIAQVFARIGPIVGTVVTYISSQIEALTKIIGGLVDFVTGVFSGDWDQAWNGLTDVVEGFVDGIESSLEAAADIVDNVVGAIWDSIANLIEDITGEGVQSWDEFKQSVEEAFDGAVSAVESGIDSIKNFFEDLVENVKQWGADVINNFITAIEEGPQMIADTLQGWYQEFVNWVQNIDWYQVGYDVTTFILEGLDYLTEELPATVSQWATDMIATVKEKASDWLESGKEIILKIVEGLKGFPDEASAEVSTWPEKISGFISDAADTLSAIGETIVEKVVEGAQAFADFMSEEVSSWPGQISTFVAENIAAFMQIGSDIGAGIREGIRKMLGGIKEMVKNVISGAEDAAREQGEMESPSRLFMRIGEDLMSGLAIGIWEGAAEVVSAIVSAFDTIDAKAVEKTNQIITNTNEMIANGIASMRQIAALEGEDIDNSMIQPFVDFVDELVTAISVVATELDGVRNQTLKMVELMTKTAEMVIETVEAMRALNYMQIPTELDQKLSDLLAFIKAITEGMAEIAVEMDGFRNETLKFAEVVAATVAIIAPTIQAMTILSNADFGKIVQGWHLADQIVIFRNIVRTLMREFLTAALEVGILSEQIEDFAKAVEAVVDVILPTIEAMRELSQTDLASIVGEWNGKTTPLADQMKILRNIVKTLIRLFAEAASEFGEGLSDSVEAFADAAGAVLDIILPTIEAMRELSKTDLASIVGEWNGSTTPLAEQMKILRNVIRTLVKLFADAAQEMSDDLYGSVEAFADAAGAVLGIVEDAISAMNMISEGVFPFDAIGGQFDLMSMKIEKLRDFIAKLVSAFETVANDMTTEMSTAVQNFADAAGAVLGIVEGAIAAMGAIEDISPFVEETGGRFDLMSMKIEKLRDFIAKLVSAFETVANDMTTEMSTAVQNFADAAGAVLGIVESAIAAMGAIGDISPFVEDAGGRFDTMTARILNLRDFIDKLVSAFEEVANDMTTEVSAAVQSFADAANSIIGLVGPGIEALKAIGDFPGVDQIGPKTQAFADQMNSAITVLATTMDYLSGFLGSKVETARKFAEDSQAIFSSVQTIADALEKIANIKMKDTTAQMEYLLNQAKTITEKLSGAAGEASSGIAAAQAFAAAIGEMVSAVQDALDQMAQLANSNVPGSVQNILDEMYKNIQSKAPNFADAASKIAEAFNKNLIEGVEKTVDLVLNILESAVGPAEKAGRDIGEGFANALLNALDPLPNQVEKIIQAIIRAFESAVGPAQKAGQDIGRALQQAIDAMGSVVDASGYSLGQSAGDGIVRGLNSRLAAVRAAARTLASAAEAGARAELEIASPSKVFQRLGEQAIAGFELPFKQSLNPLSLVSGIGTSATTYSNVREGDVNIYLSVPGGSGYASIRQEVQTAVREAMRQSGRLADSRIRMR